jgi:hypothetical protein
MNLPIYRFLKEAKIIPVSICKGIKNENNHAPNP